RCGKIETRSDLYRGRGLSSSGLYKTKTTHYCVWGAPRQTPFRGVRASVQDPLVWVEAMSTVPHALAQTSALQPVLLKVLRLRVMRLRAVLARRFPRPVNTKQACR